LGDEDRVRLGHMIEAADELSNFIVGRTQSDLESDRMLLFAMVRAIEILGEAASKVSPETRVSAPQVPWSAIVAMRNRLVHGYFDIDTRIVWRTATEEVPALLPLLRGLAGTAR
jgi:uncharacterized protein with HEPN domain